MVLPQSLSRTSRRRTRQRRNKFLPGFGYRVRVVPLRDKVLAFFKHGTFCLEVRMAENTRNGAASRTAKTSPKPAPFSGAKFRELTEAQTDEGCIWAWEIRELCECGRTISPPQRIGFRGKDLVGGTFRPNGELVCIWPTGLSNTMELIAAFWGTQGAEMIACDTDALHKWAWQVAAAIPDWGAAMITTSKKTQASKCCECIICDSQALEDLDLWNFGKRDLLRIADGLEKRAMAIRHFASCPNRKAVAQAKLAQSLWNHHRHD